MNSLAMSVVICTYTERRWDDLVAAVESVRRQTQPPLETIVVVDHNPRLFEQVHIGLPDVVVVQNSEESPGVSGARNSGVVVAKGEVVAFLDDDAVALPDWLEHLAAGYNDPNVIGVGGRTTPLWMGGQPWWFPAEFGWVLGCTYRGMPETTAPVRNVWTCNMSIRRNIFESVGGFRIGFGKVGNVSCPEDTDLCMRATQQWPQGLWLHQPDAQVRHKVSSSRVNWRYFVWRCFNEGQGKARLSRLMGSVGCLTSERDHALRTLPRGVLRGLSDAFVRRDLAGLGRAAAIVVGLGLAAAGYAQGVLRPVDQRGVAHKPPHCERNPGPGSPEA